MPPEFLIFMGVAVAIVTGGWVYRQFFSARGRARRALRKASRVPIGRAKDGELAKLCGTLRGVEQPVVGPLSKRPCAYYRTTVEQKKGSGNSSHWRTIIDESDFVQRFWIEDGTGRALVELVYPMVVLTMDNSFSSGFLDDATPDLEEFLARHGESSEGWVFNKTLRYKEGLLEEGEKVAVFGLCRWEPDPDPAAASGAGFRQQAMRLKVIAPQDNQLLLSDDVSTLK